MQIPRLALLSVLVILAVATAGSAQTKPVNGIRPIDLRAHAIVGARIVTAPGVELDAGVILIEDGVITAVGENVEVPADARVWPAEGLTVYPGLIDAAVLVKTNELPAAPGRHWNAKVHPGLSMVEQPLVDAALRKSLRSLGITAAAIYPEGGLLRGSGAVIATAEETGDVRTYRDRAAMLIGLQSRSGRGAYPGSLMGAIALVRQTLYDAQWYEACRRVYDSHPSGNEPPAPSDALAALADASAGRQPVLFDAPNELDALRGARIAGEFGLDMVLLGSGNEFRRLDEIAALGMPLVVPVAFPKAPDVATLRGADQTTLRDMMTWEQAPTNPRRLDDAGVSFAFTTHRLASRTRLFDAVRTAIDNGLDEEVALAALTTVPARMLGLEDVLGSIEPGKIASLVVVDGGLFEKGSKIRDTWVNGRRHEIKAAPEETLTFSGTLTTDEHDAVRMEIDTAKPSAVFHLEGDEKAKASAVAVVKDSISILVDGRPFGAEGYVQLNGVISAGTIAGTVAMPDGRRLPFAAVPAPPETDAEEADDEETPDAPAETETEVEVAAAEGEAPRDPVSGVWSLMVSSDEMPEAMPVTLTLEHDAEGAVTGTLSVMGQEFDITCAYDAATGEITSEFEGPGGPARLVATIAANKVSGRVSSEMMNATIEGSRDAPAAETAVASGADTEPEGAVASAPPPEELNVPLGAYGLFETPQAEDVLIVNATLWTCADDGVITGGAMLVRDGKIEAVYAKPPKDVPAGVRRIDLSGKHVTPGLIDCHSHTGISGGVNEMAQTNTAEVRIGDVVSPDDVDWYRQLAGGLTAANQLHGSANPVGGQNSVVKLKWGGSADDFVVDDAIGGIKFALGENVKRSSGRYPNTRMGVETFIRDAFTAAREYANERERYAALPAGQRVRTMPPRRDLELDALVEILEGERIIHCHSYRQDEILMLIRVADEFGFTIGTFQHVLEGYKVAEAIAAHGAGASSFSDWWAYKVEVMDAIPYNGALMTDVGILVSFNSDSDELARRMNTEAAKAVRYGGLEPAEALELVTVNPAKQLRIDHRTGSLVAGKDADFAVWSAPPLSTYARCEQTWIEGACYFDLEQDARHRAWTQAERQRLIQKLLAKKHGDAPASEPAAAEAATPTQLAHIDDEWRAWMEEQVRLGLDPMEGRPGECGCSGFELHLHAGE